MNLGGDPSQALIHATTYGAFVVSLSATDLGQGLRTVIGQIAAEAIGVGMEDVIVDTADTDSGPHDASRWQRGHRGGGGGAGVAP
jgi:CO/xanthine dehydrogenase Mo-binding subunit